MIILSSFHLCKTPNSKLDTKSYTRQGWGKGLEEGYGGCLRIKCKGNVKKNKSNQMVQDLVGIG